MPSREPIPGLTRIPENLPAMQRPPDDEAQERYWNLVVIVFVVSVTLGGLGWWSYGKVRNSLHDLRAAGLAALLEAESGTLALWIEEKKRAA